MAVRIKTLNIRLDVACEKTCTILADTFLARQALLNILENALDFIDLGGRLQIVVRREGSWVLVCIFNEGPSIPDYAIERLTERFYSLPRPRTGQKSTGLGLNFVQEIMHLHQGALVIKNRLAGVEVTLQFNAAP